jgi:predicted CopG family antitoxin
VYTRGVKTITLDEVAYKRLKAWKRGPKDSFSNVVKRLIPEAGTLASFLQFSEANRTADLPGNDVLEKSVDERSPVKNDPWN